MAEASCHGDLELAPSAPERVPLPASVERLERARRKSEDMLPIDNEDPAGHELGQGAVLMALLMALR